MGKTTFSGPVVSKAGFQDANGNPVGAQPAGTVNQIQKNDGNNGFSAIPEGTVGQVLTSAGPGQPPVFQTGTQGDITGVVAGTGLSGGGLAGTVTLDIADDGVTLSKMASGPVGALITYNGSGDPLHTALGTAGQVLTSNGPGQQPTMQAAAAGGIAAVVDDTTPQLGGNLDLNGQTINGTGNLDISNGTIKLDGSHPEGSNNTALGGDAGAGLTTGSGSNTLLGSRAGISITTGVNNVAIGRNSLDANVTSGNNVAVGSSAGGNATGADNTFLGDAAGGSVTSGSNLTVIGRNAQASSATATNEITLGNTNVTSLRIPGLQSGASTNDVLIFDGTDIRLGAAPASSPTSLNISGGTIRLDGSFPTGSNNTCLGLNAGAIIGAGASENVFIGKSAGTGITSGDRNTALGSEALSSNSTNNENTAVGYQALKQNNSGQQNTAVGQNAMSQGSQGGGSAAFGHRACYNNSGNFNTGIGTEALFTNTTGFENTAVGHNAGNNVGTGGGTANRNTFVGKSAGYNLNSGTNNTIIGRFATSSAATVDNEITLGDTGITTLRCQVTSITSLSDARDKKDVEDANIGLDFINDLRPVKFVWDTRDGAKKDIKEVGFIAQELDEVQQKHGVEDHLQLVLKNNPDKLEASQGKLIPILVQAIKDLKKEIDELKKS